VKNRPRRKRSKTIPIKRLKNKITIIIDFLSYLEKRAKRGENGAYFLAGIDNAINNYFSCNAYLYEEKRFIVKMGALQYLGRVRDLKNDELKRWFISNFSKSYLPKDYSIRAQCWKVNKSKILLRKKLSCNQLANL